MRINYNGSGCKRGFYADAKFLGDGLSRVLKMYFIHQKWNILTNGELDSTTELLWHSYLIPFTGGKSQMRF